MERPEHSLSGTTIDSSNDGAYWIQKTPMERTEHSGTEVVPTNTRHYVGTVPTERTAECVPSESMGLSETVVKPTERTANYVPTERTEHTKVQ